MNTFPTHTGTKYGKEGSTRIADNSTIFPLIKRLADLNLNSTFEKKNLMISLEGAIFISN